ncbi:LysR family transcriptional regulator [Ralstonia solanacearum]|uniref:LysR family transcriptional regulator n=1 Tax=Ralstonia solanacearum TaxID=305 RepID=A0AAW5ZJT1_RALSL|nr:LysR family transcriptional regulator [Ralstonia solanacearum]MDB0528890.1 LysR family transcriptional regulator [Ralstonia solanacearum]MDB0570262.1 LysR family transcriptional regulator [Ralstonia solanacearum]CBJ43129.1 Transcriptional regulator, LysR family [Ralstonia solanacearum CFBP2957]
MSVIHPNWNDLRIFLEVARCGTLGGAARRLKVNQSTISRHITQLEETINAPVFERDNQGLHITARGRDLIQHVEAMEANAVALSEALGGSHKEPSGAVRLGTMEGIASLYLAGACVHFNQRFPKISIELVTTTQQMHVNQREADIFLSFFPPEGKSLAVSPIGAFSLHLYASASYLASHGTPEEPADLDNHRFASYVDDLIQLDTVRWLDEVISHPRLAFQSSSMIAQMFAAVDGGGVVMLPSFARAERFGLIRLLEDQVRVRRTIWMTVHRDLQYLPRIKAVTRFLQETIARDHPLPSSG